MCFPYWLPIRTPLLSGGKRHLVFNDGLAEEVLAIRECAALLLAVTPLVFLSVDIANDLRFLFDAKSSVGEVVNTQATKRLTKLAGSFERPDVYKEVWSSSVSLVVPKGDGGEEIRCTVNSNLDVFGEEDAGGEHEVRQKLVDLERKRSVPVKYRIKVEGTECRLHVAQGTRWIPFVIFLVLTVFFLASFILELTTRTPTLSEESLP